jgi:plastocyanin
MAQSGRAALVPRLPFDETRQRGFAMRARRALRVPVAALLAAASWACGSGGSSTPTSPSPSPSAPVAGTVTVSVVGSSGNAAYQPNPVRAAVGDTVVFRNGDAATHRIVMDDGSADLGEIAPGASSRGFVVRSSSALTFHCSLHPTMVGSLNGDSAPGPPECNDPYVC